MTLQTCGSHDGNTGDFSVTVATDDICFTLEGLKRREVADLADCLMALLFEPDEEYTWHHEFQPNDVY